MNWTETHFTVIVYFRSLDYFLNASIIKQLGLSKFLDNNWIADSFPVYQFLKCLSASIDGAEPVVGRINRNANGGFDAEVDGVKLPIHAFKESFKS